MGRRSPGGYTRAVRRAMSQHRLGHRPVNHWGDGDLPAPWAAGDVVRVTDTFGREDPRAIDRTFVGAGALTPVDGLLFVGTVFSIDEGDAWYCRLDDGRYSSGRLHVAFAARSTWDHDVDMMAGVELVETLDPDGLVLRERMLADGWTLPVFDVCAECGARR